MGGGNLLIHIPLCFYSKIEDYKIRAKAFIKGFVNVYHRELFDSVNLSTLYGDTNITRFYLSHKNKIKSKERIQRISKFWKGRNIVFIEGEKSRLGVGNDLFDNAASIKRILCPAVNAFDKYDAILNEASKQKKDVLFLLALGMTATVLAYDLCRLGYQAMDLGHIDIEYEWMRMGAKTKVAIPGKYVNEVKTGRDVQTSKDKKYNSEIIARIGI